MIINLFIWHFSYFPQYYIPRTCPCSMTFHDSSLFCARISLDHTAFTCLYYIYWFTFCSSIVFYNVLIFAFARNHVCTSLFTLPTNRKWNYVTAEDNSCMITVNVLVILEFQGLTALIIYPAGITRIIHYTVHIYILTIIFC